MPYVVLEEEEQDEKARALTLRKSVSSQNRAGYLICRS